MVLHKIDDSKMILELTEDVYLKLSCLFIFKCSFHQWN